MHESMHQLVALVHMTAAQSSFKIGQNIKKWFFICGCKHNNLLLTDWKKVQLLNNDRYSLLF
jgi:hypothetical protein